MSGLNFIAISVYLIVLLIQLNAFNRCNTKLMWDLWWGGNPVENYAPYKRLRGFDLSSNKEGVLLSKAKTVMQKIVEHHPQCVLSATEINTLNVRARDEYFALSFVNLYDKLNTDTGGVEMFDRYRVGEIAYSTLYDAIKISFPNAQRM